MSGRIDVHQHLIPPEWQTALGGPVGWPMPRWSPRLATDLMDAHGIATGIVSVTAPGVVIHSAPGAGTNHPARDLAVAVNDYAAELAADQPKRFGFFASLPLPDVEGALIEARRALDDLRADGIVLLSNVGDRYLGDPDYDPLWAELDRRGAVVFVHPAQPSLSMLTGTPAPMADFVFDTTRTALNMVLHGIPRRYPRMKVILAHGGGFVPYAAHRFAALAPHQAKPPLGPEEVLAGLRWFYFDTAMSASPTSLPSLLAFAQPGHVLYGSDWPFAPADVGAYFDRFLDTELAGATLAEINRNAAERLFPRLAPIRA
jgi:predicted TIM-barrel fold metal-dependent hydrolase